jgi:hypothetical protein
MVQLWIEPVAPVPLAANVPTHDELASAMETTTTSRASTTIKRGIPMVPRIFTGTPDSEERMRKAETRTRKRFSTPLDQVRRAA